MRSSYRSPGVSALLIYDDKKREKTQKIFNLSASYLTWYEIVPARFELAYAGPKPAVLGR